MGIFSSSVQPQRKNKMDIRTGFGYDIHQLEEIEDSYILLSQVKVKGNLHIVSHSDGDIVLHSLSNAILSALGKEDIGYYFPDNSEKTLNMSSFGILSYAMQEMNKMGYRISNVVVDILLQKPKILPYREQIKENLSDFLHLDISTIGLSCNTGEHVDAVGNSKAIVVYSQVLLMKD
jgi:2-C-methyl-D-erythritol 2,4-cyclodiphosphate synthase